MNNAFTWHYPYQPTSVATCVTLNYETFDQGWFSLVCSQVVEQQYNVRPLNNQIRTGLIDVSARCRTTVDRMTVTHSKQNNFHQCQQDAEQWNAAWLRNIQTGTFCISVSSKMQNNRMQHDSYTFTQGRFASVFQARCRTIECNMTAKHSNRDVLHQCFKPDAEQ